MKQRFHLCRVGGLAVFGALLLHLSNLGAEETKSRQMIDNSEVSSSAFEAMMPVLRHPRCMNCHSSGDFPRQGDDSHPHIMDVRRGTDGHGVNGVKCTTCHQDHNLPGVHMPPGAPDWGLPSSTTPMIWEGLNDRELCQLFKDPKRNGHRTVAQIVEHMHTPLVLWGWSPGEGRTPIPYSEKSFLENVKLWAENGAGCPVENSNH